MYIYYNFTFKINKQHINFATNDGIAFSTLMKHNLSESVPFMVFFLLFYLISILL